MKKLRFRKVRLQCQVAGCKNTDCYALTHSRENGHSVVMCLDCMKKCGLLASQILKDGCISKNGELAEPEVVETPEQLEPEPTNTDTSDIFDVMTAEQLAIFAEENKIDIGKATSRDGILKKLSNFKMTGSKN